MKFYKIQGTGNDFIIISNLNKKFSDSMLKYIAEIVCRRKISLGADGFISIEKSSDIKADFKMNFFNKDGSVAEMCGNGARCVARFAYENNIAGELMNIETMSGIYHAERVNKRLYKIEFMWPSVIEINRKMIINDEEYGYTYIELGNPGIPHVLIRYNKLFMENQNKLLQIAKRIRYNKSFINGTNVTFYDIISDDMVQIRTYERGVENFTLACGTASIASAVNVFTKSEIKSSNISIKTDGGELLVVIGVYDDININSFDKRIRCNENNFYDRCINKVYLIGDTKLVACGEIIDEELNLI